MVVEENMFNGGALKSERGNERQISTRQRFLVLRKLGQGTYGKVQLAINKETNQEVAIKTIKKTRIVNAEDMVRIRREIKIMSTIRHPNIIHIYEVFETKEKIVLVMQYASGGELYDYLGCHKTLPEDEARRIFRQIAAAIFYCHKNQICHRDLKLENILLDEEGNTKIADFGLSNIFDGQKKMSTFCGSPLYASPEIVKGTPYNGPEVDCWSLGVLLFALVYGTMPFDGRNFKELVSQISEGNYNEPAKKSSASGLIRRLLTINVSQRADIYSVCSDEWVNRGYQHSLLDLADCMSGPARLGPNKFNVIEKKSSSTECEENSSLCSKAIVCDAEKLQNFKTFNKNSTSKEFVFDSNHIPHIKTLNGQLPALYQQQNIPLADERNVYCDVIYTINNIIDTVVKIIQIPVENEQQMNLSSKSSSHHEIKLVDETFQKNGITKIVQIESECAIPIVDDSRATVHSIENFNLINKDDSNRQSCKSLNNNLDDLAFSSNDQTEKTIKTENEATGYLSDYVNHIPLINQNETYSLNYASPNCISPTDHNSHVKQNEAYATNDGSQNFSPSTTRNYVFNGDSKENNNTTSDTKEMSNGEYVMSSDIYQKRARQEPSRKKAARGNGNTNTESFEINWFGKKGSDLLFLQASRRRSNSLCKTLAFTFECGIHHKDSSSKSIRKCRKPPGKVIIPKTFDSPELTEYLTEKERLIIFPCVSVSENKEIIQKKIERVKNAAINIIPRRNSDVSTRVKKKRYTRSHTEKLPGEFYMNMCNNCLLNDDDDEMCNGNCSGIYGHEFQTADILSSIEDECCENDENFFANNFSLCEETDNEFMSEENRTRDPDLSQKCNFLNIQNMTHDEENGIALQEENHHAYSMFTDATSLCVHCQMNYKQNMRSLNSNTGHFPEDTDCLEYLGKSIPRSFSSSTSGANDNYSPKQNCDRCRKWKCGKFSQKHVFKKSKSKECDYETANHILNGTDNYFSNERLLQECNISNSCSSEWNSSNKSCCFCSLDKCCSLKSEDNLDHYHEHNHSDQSFKCMFKDSSLSCQKCELLQVIHNERLSSSVPNLNELWKRTKSDKYKINIKNKKLSKSTETLYNVINSRKARRNKFYQEELCRMKNLQSENKSDLNFNSLLRHWHSHERFQSNFYDDNVGSQNLSSSFSIESLQPKKAFSDLDIRCNKPTCDRKFSLDNYSIPKSRSRKTHTSAFSINELNRNGTKRKCIVPKKFMHLGRNMPLGRKADQTLKLNSMKRIQEAKMELSRSVSSQKQEDSEESSGSLLEALKMHGYRNVISQRLQNDTEEDDVQDSLFYTNSTLRQVPLDYDRFNFSDYNHTIFRFCPNMYSFNMQRKKSIPKGFLSDELTQRYNRLIQYNNPIINPLQRENLAVDMDYITYVPPKINPDFQYPIFSSGKIDSVLLLNSLKGGKGAPNQRNHRIYNDIESDAYSLDSEMPGNSDEALYKIPDIKGFYPTMHAEVAQSIRPTEPVNNFATGKSKFDTDVGGFEKSVNSGYQTVSPNIDSDKEESVSHRIWRKSFYSRFNHVPLSRKTKAYSLESDDYRDSRLLESPEESNSNVGFAFDGLSDRERDDNHARSIQHRRNEVRRKSSSPLSDTLLRTWKKSGQFNSTFERNKNCEKENTVSQVLSKPGTDPDL